jgi:hypothetical protein
VDKAHLYEYVKEKLKEIIMKQELVKENGLSRDIKNYTVHLIKNPEKYIAASIYSYGAVKRGGNAKYLKIFHCECILILMWSG